jgi:hypothetical protein
VCVCSEQSKKQHISVRAPAKPHHAEGRSAMLAPCCIEELSTRWTPCLGRQAPSVMWHCVVVALLEQSSSSRPLCALSVLGNGAGLWPMLLLKELSGLKPVSEAFLRISRGPCVASCNQDPGTKVESRVFIMIPRIAPLSKEQQDSRI